MNNSREISLLKSDHCQDEEDSKTTNTPSTMQTIAGVMGKWVCRIISQWFWRFHAYLSTNINDLYLVYIPLAIFTLHH